VLLRGKTMPAWALLPAVMPQPVCQFRGGIQLIALRTSLLDANVLAALAVESATDRSPP
jgi:hypothetical protein